MLLRGDRHGGWVVYFAPDDNLGLGHGVKLGFREGGRVGEAVRVARVINVDAG